MFTVENDSQGRRAEETLNPKPSVDMRDCSAVQAFYDSRGADGNAPPLEFDTGVDAVPEAVDMCIRLMTPQEVAVVQTSHKFAYDGRSDRPPVSFILKHLYADSCIIWLYIIYSLIQEYILIFI